MLSNVSIPICVVTSQDSSMYQSLTPPLPTHTHPHWGFTLKKSGLGPENLHGSRCRCCQGPENLPLDLLKSCMSHLLGVFTYGGPLVYVVPSYFLSSHSFRCFHCLRSYLSSTLLKDKTEEKLRILSLPDQPTTGLDSAFSWGNLCSCLWSQAFSSMVTPKGWAFPSSIFFSFSPLQNGLLNKIACCRVKIITKGHFSYSKNKFYISNMGYDMLALFRAPQEVP